MKNKEKIQAVIRTEVIAASKLRCEQIEKTVKTVLAGAPPPNIVQSCSPISSDLLPFVEFTPEVDEAMANELQTYIDAINALSAYAADRDVAPVRSLIASLQYILNRALSILTSTDAGPQFMQPGPVPFYPQQPSPFQPSQQPTGRYPPRSAFEQPFFNTGVKEIK